MSALGEQNREKSEVKSLQMLLYELHKLVSLRALLK